MNKYVVDGQNGNTNYSALVKRMLPYYITFSVLLIGYLVIRIPFNGVLVVFDFLVCVPLLLTLVILCLCHIFRGNATLFLRIFFWVAAALVVILPSIYYLITIASMGGI